VNSTRKISIATGVLLIVATVAAIAAGAVQPAITGSDYLVGVASHPLRMAASAFAYLLAAVTSVGIAVALYPLLKRTHAALALGAVVFRTIEAVFYTAGVVSLLAIASLANEMTAAPTTDREPIQTIADTLGKIHDHSSAVAVFAFCIGAFMYSLALYRTRLLPRWLSGWGLLAALSMEIAVVLSIVADTSVTGYIPLIAPIALQEMVLAVWLLVNGFSSTTQAPAEAGRRS
jgi:hypothetical protein